MTEWGHWSQFARKTEFLYFRNNRGGGRLTYDSELVHQSVWRIKPMTACLCSRLLVVLDEWRLQIYPRLLSDPAANWLNFWYRSAAPAFNSNLASPTFPEDTYLKLILVVSQSFYKIWNATNDCSCLASEFRVSSYPLRPLLYLVQ